MNASSKLPPSEAEKPDVRGGLEEFWDVLKDLRRFWGIIAAGASLPLLAHLVDIAPPWPPGVTTLTSIALIVATVLAYQSARSRRLSGWQVTRRLRFSAICLALFLLTYLLGLSLFTYRPPGTDVTFVKGYQCTKFVAEVDECPFLSNEILKNGQWDPTIHWTQPSIAVVRVSLVAIWLATFYSLSSLLSGFIAYWRMRRPGK